MPDDRRPQLPAQMQEDQFAAINRRRACQPDFSAKASQAAEVHRSKVPAGCRLIRAQRIDWIDAGGPA